jgi:histidyl-tRNA synthetase
MARPTPLSGFPEWLPGGRVVEQHVLDVLRRTFELHGFAGIETRAVEPLDQLLRKGETSKEVYVLQRLQEEPGADAASRGGRLGLHFDLTVPFARYVLENAGHLSFPFRRYQIQKVWRAGRAAAGGAVPRVRPGRRRRRGRRGAAVPLRGRAAAGDR